MLENRTNKLRGNISFTISIRKDRNEKKVKVLKKRIESARKDNTQAMGFLLENNTLHKFQSRSWQNYSTLSINCKNLQKHWHSWPQYFDKNVNIDWFNVRDRIIHVKQPFSSNWWRNVLQWSKFYCGALQGLWGHLICATVLKFLFLRNI